jgi:hypothetical protein
LEGAGENKVRLRVPRPARELKDEMVFVAGGDGHAPETIREIDFLPMDDPIVRGVVHEVDKFGEHRAQGLDRVLVGGRALRGAGPGAAAAAAGVVGSGEGYAHREVEDDAAAAVDLGDDCDTGDFEVGRRVGRE